MAYNRKKTYKGKKRNYKRKYTSRYRKRQTVEKTVKKVLNKSSETKIANFNTGVSLIKFNSGINVTSDIHQLVPNISKGVGINERVGDSIRAQSMRIKGYVKLDISTSSSIATSTAVLVRLMIVSLKSKSNFSEVVISSSPLNGLIRRGGSTQTFSGYLNDINAELNTKLWTKHIDTQFYLSQDYLHTLSGSSNVKNTVKFFDFNIKCKGKVLKYDDGTSSGILPTNFSPVLLVGYTYLNGGGPDTTNTAVGIYYDSDLYYKDI